MSERHVRFWVSIFVFVFNRGGVYADGGSVPIGITIIHAVDGNGAETEIRRNNNNSKCAVVYQTIDVLCALFGALPQPSPHPPTYDE